MQTDPTAWRREVLDQPSRWERHLDERAHRELEAAVARLRGRPLDTLGPADAGAGEALDAVGAWAREAVRTWPGFVLLRGLDVDRFGPDVHLAYLALGLRLGTPAPQNLAGELLTHVRDTGADPQRIETRLYTTRAEQDFHTDGADVIGLLCLRTAVRGGESLLASSPAIVEELRRTEPALHDALFSPFPWHYQEAGQPALWFERPICTRTAAGGLNTFFIPWYIHRSQTLPDAPRLTDVQRAAVDAVSRLANDPRFAISMQFRPGDVQLLKNAAILHKRTAYDDHDDPALRRHLLRLWLSAPDFEDGDAQLRRGVVQP